MDIVSILTHLIELKCVNDPAHGVYVDKRCAEAIADLMRSAGMEPRILESHSFYTLYHIEERGRPIIAFLAHYDVVPPGSGWSRDPFRPTIEGDRLYGRGALDDLSNVAILIAIYKELAKATENATLIIAFTGDEEIGGCYGAKVLREALMKQQLIPDALVNCDGVGMAVINKRRNVFNVVLEVDSRREVVKGFREIRKYKLESRKYHAAYFIAGADIHPLIRLARDVHFDGLFIANLKGSFVKSNVLPIEIEAEVIRSDNNGDSIEVDKNLTKLIECLIPLTKISIDVDFDSFYGITITPNLYAFKDGKHRLVLDVRAPLYTADKLRIAIERIARDYIGDVEVHVSEGSGYLYTPPTSRIVKFALEALKEIGCQPRVAEGAGASDSRYFSPLGIEAIDFGPLGDNAHGPDEYVVIPSLYRTAQFYVSLAKKLAKTSS